MQQACEDESLEADSLSELNDGKTSDHEAEHSTAAHTPRNEA